MKPSDEMARRDGFESLAHKLIEEATDGPASPSFIPFNRAVNAVNAALSTQPDIEAMREALEAVRACRLPERVMETVHGPQRISERWNVSGLTKLLPQIDNALAKTGGA